jgi:single-strand DNA-binding protein
MARGINKVILVGTLGADPEVRYTTGGAAIATFSLATNEEWKDKQTGEKKERTEWHRCKAFARQGEVLGEYAKKGKQLYVEGMLRTDKYTDKDGIERFSTGIIVTTFQFIGSPDRNDDAGDQRSQSGDSRSPRQGSAPSQQRSAASRSAPPPTPPPADNFEDDEIPF